MTEPDAKSPNLKTLLVATAALAVLSGVAWIVTVRPASQATGRPDAPVASAAAPGVEATAEGRAPPSVSAPRTAVHATSSSGLRAATQPPSDEHVAQITSGAPVDMAQLLLEAKTVEAARTSLASGNPRQALKELELYDKIPHASSLRQEALLLKIEALSLVGRKAEARALAYATRDDPSFDSYQGRIATLLNNDAGR